MLVLHVLLGISGHYSKYCSLAFLYLLCTAHFIFFIHFNTLTNALNECTTHPFRLYYFFLQPWEYNKVHQIIRKRRDWMRTIKKNDYRTIFWRWVLISSFLVPHNRDTLQNWSNTGRFKFFLTFSRCRCTQQDTRPSFFFSTHMRSYARCTYIFVCINIYQPSISQLISLICE